MHQVQILLALLLVVLSLYLVLGGADFGAGIWEFNTGLQSSLDERTLIYNAIGPVWEMNHVWLIFALVLLFSAFPGAFGALFQALWIPLFLVLGGIVFRGMAYAFRSVLDDPKQRRPWEGIFAIASMATPFFLGTSAGAVAEGRLAIASDGSFHGDFLRDWISPLSLFCGVFTIGICAFLASVYLYRECNVKKLKPAIQKHWRGRALFSGQICGMLALAGLFVCYLFAPVLAQALWQKAWPLVLASMLCGVGALAMLLASLPTAAAILAAAAAANVVWAWGLAQYPHLTSGLALDTLQAPIVVMNAMLICIAAGMLLLLPSMFWLLKVFKSSDSGQMR